MRRKEHLQRLHVHQLNYQYTDGTYPTTGNIGYISNTTGNIDWSSAVSLDGTTVNATDISAGVFYSVTVHGPSSDGILTYDDTALLVNDLPIESGGPAGPTGPMGVQGPNGFTGPIGYVGMIGVTGPQGIQGTIGPQGIGSQGAQGVVGTVGLTGPMGSQGATGLQGALGWQGVQGTFGPTGPAGPHGPQGPQGITGPQGIYVNPTTPTQPLPFIYAFMNIPQVITLSAPPQKIPISTTFSTPFSSLYLDTSNNVVAVNPGVYSVDATLLFELSDITTGTITAEVRVNNSPVLIKSIDYNNTITNYISLHRIHTILETTTASSLISLYVSSTAFITSKVTFAFSGFIPACVTQIFVRRIA
jgi:hypothetical protein